MSPSQRNDLVNSTETTPKGKRLLLNMYNNPNQKTLEEYRNFKYNNFFKPTDTEVKPTEKVTPTENVWEYQPPQEISSAKTSLNQLAAIYKNKIFQDELTEEKIIVDIGGGAFT